MQNAFHFNGPNRYLIFPIMDKQTKFSSFIFGGEFHMNFPLFLSTINELVLLPSFCIPNPSELRKSKSWTSPSNLIQPKPNILLIRIVIQMVIGMLTCCICAQAEVWKTNIFGKFHCKHCQQCQIGFFFVYLT